MIMEQINASVFFFLINRKYFVKNEYEMIKENIRYRYGAIGNFTVTKIFSA